MNIKEAAEKVIDGKIEQSTKPYNERYREAERALDLTLQLQRVKFEDFAILGLRKLIQASFEATKEEDMEFAKAFEEIKAKSIKGEQILQEIRHKLIINNMQKAAGNDSN